MFNFLIAKKKETIKIGDGLTCEVIGNGTVNVTCKDETVRTLEGVQYVPEARYNLISIEVLDEEGCRIQVQ